MEAGKAAALAVEMGIELMRCGDLTESWGCDQELGIPPCSHQVAGVGRGRAGLGMGILRCLLMFPEGV